ncbi:hypothetical protein ACFX11_017017 [Malus domestica]
MWYTCLSDYLINQGYELRPCVLNYEVLFRIARVAVYVNDMNLTKTLEELEKTTSHMKTKFRMKDFGKSCLYLDLKLKRCSDGTLVYQSNYIPKVLPFSIPMIFHMLYANETLEEVMESEIPYLSSTLRLYLAHCVR